MANILDAYSEDGDFIYFNGAIGSGIDIQTSGESFRSGFGRCAVGVNNTTAFARRTWASGAVQTAWLGHRVFCNSSDGGFNSSAPPMFALVDQNDILRIMMILNPTPNLGPIGPYYVYKVDAAGSQTLLGTTIAGFSGAPSIPDRFSVHFDYSTSGFLNLYINGNSVFSYNGDITTDSVTALAGAQYGTYNGGAYNSGTYWTECILSDGDTRDMSLVTCYATGAGSTDQWTGAYTNVNEIVVNDSEFDTTTTSGNVQLYEMSSIPTGNFDIITLVTNLRASQGAGSLSHIALTQSISGSIYTTAPESLPASLSPVQFIQNVNPATGEPWTQNDINTSLQSGYTATT